MPHTSRRKKVVNNNKRQNIVDKDGWTRITTSALSAKEERNQKPNGEGAEPLYTSTPVKPEEGLTLEKLLERYKKIESSWKQSNSCKELERVVASRCQNSFSGTTKCICFGTGSFSGLLLGWIARHDNAFYQIAAFRSVIDTIERSSGTRPAAFAQEPNYNELDADFLEILSITKADHPTGFDLIDSKSLVYCPGAERFVVQLALERSPAMYLGGELELYSGKEARSWSRGLGTRHPKDEPILSVEDTRYTGDEEVKSMAELSLRRTVSSSSIVNAFMSGKDMARLPDLDAKDQPFHAQYLYWRTEANSD